jgi:cellulose biosynthesis protein BcsQ
MKAHMQMLTTLQTAAARPGGCSVTAFTASQPGEGTSYVTASFGVELARKTRRRTLIADIGSLQRANIDNYRRASKFCFQTNVKNLYVLPGEDQDFETIETSSETHLEPVPDLERGFVNLETLRQIFDHILLDCPSLQASENALLFARAADAMIVVVEAGRTRRDQIRNAVRTIEAAKGNLAGCVLNKRTYPVPDWLYRRI